MKARALPPSPEGVFERTLRQIVREELRNALADLAGPAAPKAYVSSVELIESLSISRATLRGMMRDGLPYTKPGKYPRFSVAEVETWLAARRVGSA